MDLDGGWIYVFMTASDYNRYKVGLTKNNPMLRLAQLKTGDPKMGFEVAYFIPNSLGVKLSKMEKIIHAELGPSIEFYNEMKSEWFRGNPRNAWRELDSIFTHNGYEITDWIEPSEKKIVRLFEEDLISLYKPPFDTSSFFSDLSLLEISEENKSTQKDNFDEIFPNPTNDFDDMFR